MTGRTGHLTAVFSAPFLGGSELFNLEFLRDAHARGVTIDAVIPAAGALEDALAPIARAVTVVPAPPEVTSLSRFDERLPLDAVAQRARALAAYVRRLRRVLSAGSGAVCALGFRAQLGVALAGFGLRRPVVWVVHEVVPRGPFQQIWGVAAARADLALTYSSAAGSQPGLRRTRVEVLPVRLDLEQFERLPDPSHPPRVLGLVGDLFPLKNHLAAVEVVRRLRASGHDVVGSIVGRDTSDTNPTAGYVAEVTAAIRESQGAVSLAAATPAQMPDRIADMDVLLHLSTVPESFGRVCVEAMAGGRPVVAYDHGAVSEVVNGAGVLRPVGDVDGVVEAVRRLREDREAFSGLVQRARSSAIQRFGPAVAGQTIGASLARFAGGHTA